MGPSRKSFLWGVLCGVLVVVLGAWAGLIGYVLYHRTTPEQVADELAAPPIPAMLDADFTLPLKTLDGRPFDFSQLRGKVIFLVFWNPDCLTCKAELPSIQTLYEKTGEDRIAVVLAAISGEAREAAAVASRYHVTAPMYMVQGPLPPVFRCSAPSVFVINPAGKIAFSHLRPARWDGDDTANFLRSLAAPDR